jgi:hypothetical protein
VNLVSRLTRTSNQCTKPIHTINGDAKSKPSRNYLFVFFKKKYPIVKNTARGPLSIFSKNESKCPFFTYILSIITA